MPGSLLGAGLCNPTGRFVGPPSVRSFLCIAPAQQLANLAKPTHVTAIRQQQVIAGKRNNGKKKPKSANQAAAPGPATGVPSPPPLRINNTSRLPLKNQIRYVKAAKQPAAQQPAERSAFRRTKDAEEAKAQAEAEREQHRQGRKYKTQTAGFANLYGTKGEENPPILLVDGYNVCFYRARCTDEVSCGDLSGERERLQADLVEYSQHKGVKVVIAYDAMSNERRGTSRETLPGEVDVVFCGDSEADSWLMQEANQLKARGNRSVFVATNDRDVKDTIAPGVYTVSTHRLLGEMKKVAKEQEAWAQEQKLRQLGVSRGTGSLGAVIFNKDPSMLDRLWELAQGDRDVNT